MKILFVNESQGENLGDQAIYQGIKNLFEGNLKVDKISRLQLSFTPNKNKNKNTTEKYLFLKKYKYIYLAIMFLRFFIYNIKRNHIVMRKIKNNDLVVFGGGSLLINNKFAFPINILYISVICILMKRKFGFAGVSTRVIDNTLVKHIFKFILNKSEFLYVRDVESRQKCSDQFNVKAEYIPDFALLLRTIPLEENGKIAINVMGKQTHGFFSNENNILKYKEKLLKFINECTHKKITLFTTGELMDECMIGDLINEISKNKVLEVVFPEDLNSLYDVYIHHEFIISTRLHSAIIGLALGRNIICFNWDDKVSGFFKSVKLDDSLIETTQEFDLDKCRRLDVNVRTLFEPFVNEVISYA